MFIKILRQKHEQMKNKYPMMIWHIILVALSIFAIVAIYINDSSVCSKVMWISFLWLLVQMVLHEYVDKTLVWAGILAIPAVSFVISASVVLWQSSLPLWAKIGVTTITFVFGLGGKT